MCGVVCVCEGMLAGDLGESALQCSLHEAVEEVIEHPANEANEQDAGDDDVCALHFLCINDQVAQTAACGDEFCTDERSPAVAECESCASDDGGDGCRKDDAASVPDAGKVQALGEFALFCGNAAQAVACVEKDGEK